MTEARSPMPEWLTPVLVAAVAVPTFAAFWIGGRPLLGALWASANLVFAVVLAVGRRSDTLRLAGGLDDDERARELEYRAGTATALVLTVALVVLFLAAGVRGETGLVYGGLLLLGEATRLAALGVLGRRS